MNHAELVRSVSELSGIKKADVSKVLYILAALISAELRKEQEVRLKDVGVFILKSVPAAFWRNPATGETVQMPARKKAAFRMSGRLRRIGRPTVE